MTRRRQRQALGTSSTTGTPIAGTVRIPPCNFPRRTIDRIRRGGGLMDTPKSRSSADERPHGSHASFVCSRLAETLLRLNGLGKSHFKSNQKTDKQGGGPCVRHRDAHSPEKKDYRILQALLPRCHSWRARHRPTRSSRQRRPSRDWALRQSSASTSASSIRPSSFTSSAIVPTKRSTSSIPRAMPLSLRLEKGRSPAPPATTIPRGPMGYCLLTAKRFGLAMATARSRYSAGHRGHWWCHRCPPAVPTASTRCATTVATTWS